MQTVDHFREQGYYPATASLSQNVRTFAVAGIGLVWLFSSKVTDTSLDPSLEFTLPYDFLLVVWLMMIALCFDFLQYLYQAAFWGWYCDKKEREFYKQSKERLTVFEVPRYVNFPSKCFFLGKVLVLGYGYIELFIVLNSKISFIETFVN